VIAIHVLMEDPRLPGVSADIGFLCVVRQRKTTG
jgi:hypothetical protein